MNTDSDKLIWIKTTRHSEFIRAILNAYSEHAAIKVNSSLRTMDDLLSNWCTNAKIRNTHEFELWQYGNQLFGFHDGPDNFWVAYSELPFVKSLKEQGLVRYEILSKAPTSMFDRVINWLASFFSA
jgi:hypothetical protein